MPDDITPTAAEVAANNTAIAAKLEAQGKATAGGATAQEIQDSGSALDLLAAAVVEKKEDSPADPIVEPAATPAPPDAAAVEEAARVAAERTETLKRSEEFFKDSPSLPPGASPKSSESFAAIKIKATQEIAARDAQLEETKKKLAEAEAKIASGSPELTRELEEHRLWRAKLDVDADPKFKEFDKTVASSQEFIYAQLRKSASITPEIIDQIKKLGGPENVNMEKIFEAVKDSTTQRLVEAKLADIEMAKFNKEQAIAETKKNIGKYVEDQQKTYAANVGSHNKATEQHFAQMTTKLPWFVEKPVDAKADEPTRKNAEAHNTFLKETKAQLAEALKDDSAEMRAIMLAGMAQLLYLQKVHVGQKAQLEAATKSLAEANTKLAKFTNASVSRIRESGAAPGQGNAKPKGLDMNPHSGDALDNIAKQVMAERAAKANA